MQQLHKRLVAQLSIALHKLGVYQHALGIRLGAQIRLEPIVQPFHVSRAIQNRLVQQPQGIELGLRGLGEADVDLLAIERTQLKLR